VDFYFSPLYVRDEYLEIADENCNRESFVVIIKTGRHNVAVYNWTSFQRIKMGLYSGKVIGGFGESEFNSSDK